MTDDQLSDEQIQEDAKLLASHLRHRPAMELALRPRTVMRLMASLQLALRHPEFPDSIKPTIENCINAMIQHLSAGHRNIELLLHRGSDPQYDAKPLAVEGDANLAEVSKTLRLVLGEEEFTQLVSGGHVSKRFDKDGRDITDLNGLADQADTGLLMILSDVDFNRMTDIIDDLALQAGRS